MAGGGRRQYHQFTPPVAAKGESAMDMQRIIGRFGRGLLWCTLGALLALSPDTASAQSACGQFGTSGNLDPGTLCQDQTQYAVSYTGWQTQGWAYHCSDPNNVYTNYWPSTYGIAFSNSCFTVAENPVNDAGDQSKADANYTNWCVDNQSLTVVLACWNEPPGTD